MSYNISINLFGPDSLDTEDASPTNFYDYYEGRIDSVMHKFARRFNKTIPLEPIVNPDLDQKEKLLQATVDLVAATIKSAATYAETLGDLRMKHLYVKEYFNEEQPRLNPFLHMLRPVTSICPWVCIPFMNYSWTTTDLPNARRPNENAYNAHLYGAPNPSLPTNSPASPQNPLGGPTMDIRSLDYAGFTYFDTTNDAQLQRTYKLTRLFAMAWNFIDPVDIVTRHAMRSGTLPIGDEDAPEYFEEHDGKSIRSSGNGYRCVGGICSPSNPSAFCVSSSCP